MLAISLGILNSSTHSQLDFEIVDRLIRIPDFVGKSLWLCGLCFQRIQMQMLDTLNISIHEDDCFCNSTCPNFFHKVLWNKSLESSSTVEIYSQSDITELHKLS